VPTLTGSITGRHNGDTITATYATTATASSLPGAYPIVATLVDPDGKLGNYTVSIIDGTLTVTPEDARATYTGAFFAATASANSSIATVTLSATVQDITVVANDASHDPDAGDVRHALVTFVNRETGAILCQDLPVGLVTLGDTRTGTATCNWTTDIGRADGAEYLVGIVVTGAYTRNASQENAYVVVARPLNNLIRGGGNLVLSNSAGQIPGDPGSKASFGLNIRYTRTGANARGNAGIIVTSGGRTYQIKSNAITSLAVDATTGTATLNARASIQDITDPLHPISIDGNASLQLTMTDRGEPGTNDTLSITVWNKAGGLWFANTWDGKKTVEQPLGGGSLAVQ
jgi:hypothetical protein